MMGMRASGAIAKTACGYYRSWINPVFTKEKPMAKVYWIAAYRSVSNPEALAAYAKLAGPAIVAAGGKILARGAAAAVKEQGLKERTVLIEFESMEKAMAAYESPAYKEALAALGPSAAERDIRIRLKDVDGRIESGHDGESPI